MYPLSCILEAITVPFRYIFAPRVGRHEGPGQLPGEPGSCPHRFQEMESQLESGGAPEAPPRLCPAVTTPTPSRRHVMSRAAAGARHRRPTGRQPPRRRRARYSRRGRGSYSHRWTNDEEDPVMTSAEEGTSHAPVSFGVRDWCGHEQVVER